MQRIALVPVLLLATIISVGCSKPAQRIETGGTQSVTTVDKIDPRDWNDAADEMLESLFESDALAGYNADNIAVLGISRVVNDTTQHVNVDQLTNRIRTVLRQSGKVKTTTVIGLGGKVEDPMAKSEIERKKFMEEEEKPAKVQRPDFTLSGKISRDSSRAGNVKEVTYSFTLRLTNTSSGLAEWEDSKYITKQGSKNTVGW